MRETEKKYFEPNNNESIASQNLLSEDEVLIGGKFIALNAYTGREERFKVSDLSFLH